MNLIRISIERPIAVLAAVFMIVLFGLLFATFVTIVFLPAFLTLVLRMMAVFRGDT